jgi:LysM repeat protein
MNNVKQIAIGRTRLSWLIVLSFTLLLVTTRTTQAQTGASHLVAPGETLTQIANRYETDVATLLRLNALSDPSLIRAGQRLAIPANVIGSGAGREYDMAPVTELGTAGESRIYLAQPGDTLASVAAAFQTTTARLTEMNQRSPSALLARGEALRVPLPASAVFAPRTADDIPVPGKYYIHVVQEGETLAGIAAAYGTSVRRTQETNGLTGGAQLKPGQRIVVPPPSYAELFNDAPMGDTGVPEYPLVPTTEKWISVDLDHQRAYAWEGDKLLKKFAISSGKARTPHRDRRLPHPRQGVVADDGGRQRGGGRLLQPAQRAMGAVFLPGLRAARRLLAQQIWHADQPRLRQPDQRRCQVAFRLGVAHRVVSRLALPG